MRCGASCNGLYRAAQPETRDHKSVSLAFKLARVNNIDGDKWSGRTARERHSSIHPSQNLETQMLRSRTILVLIAGVAVPVWLWQRAAPQPDPQHTISPRSPNSSKPADASTATGTDGGVPPPASTAADARPTLAAPVAPDPALTASNAVPAPAHRSAPVRLDVRAPSTARVGDRVTVTIDAEAFGGIRNLAFTAVYDRKVLDLVSSSPGSFVQQASAPATFGADDPSSGNVLVNMDIKNGGVVSGAGTVVVLEFTALSAGTSQITLGDVSFLESGRSSNSTAAAVQPASVTIE